MSNYLEELNNAVWEPPATISDIHIYEDGNASLSLDNSTGFGIEAKYEPSRFAVGQVIQICGGLGRPIKGVKVDGKIIFFKTEDDLVKEHQEWLEKYRAEKKVKYEQNKDKWLADIEALPDTLRARMHRFMDADPKFLEDDQGYELFVVQESVKFSEYFKKVLSEKFPGGTASMDDAQALFKEFMDLPVSERHKLVDFSTEHSGNTFGGAVAIGMRVAMNVEV